MVAAHALLPASFAAVAVVVGAVSLWGQAAWLRAGAFCCLVAALAVLWWASLGWPRPILDADLPLIGVPAGTVAAFVFDEPRAIYVWLVVPGGRVPIALQLPWQEDDAAALVRAAEQAKRNGTDVHLRQGRAPRTGERPRGSASAGSPPTGSPMFYAAPAPALPPKHVPAGDSAREP
ncbi:MAG TPA: hypothetical protein VMF62_17415 [Acetobacteraceae bacterium]|jgi:hypothetical protein|nr:hypothetical protein [Acetobacteraceae bacterium]